MKNSWIGDPVITVELQPAKRLAESTHLPLLNLKIIKY